MDQAFSTEVQKYQKNEDAHSSIGLFLMKYI